MAKEENLVPPSGTSVWRWLGNPLGTWAFGPNDDANATYQTIKGRWAALIAWGMATKAPENIGLLTHWQQWSKDWEGVFSHQDPRELSGMANELATAESNAIKHGYAVPGSPPMSSPGVVAPPHSPDPTLSSRAGEGATAVDKAVTPTDPYLGVKIAGIGAIALGTVAGSIAAKSDGAKVGVAVGGTLFALGAAWFAFAPKPKGATT